MEQVEQKFYDVCQMYNDRANNIFKGNFLFEAFKKVKFDEELLASYITVKEKYDCLYAFLVTRTRILEISVYSTMCITQSKKYREIKKVYVEKSFDDLEIAKVINEEGLPERVQFKASFVDDTNQVEDIVFENIEKRENITQILEFARNLNKLQIGN